MESKKEDYRASNVVAISKRSIARKVSKGRDCFSMQTRGGLNAILSSDILLFLFIPRGIKASAKASCRGGVGISNHQVRTNISLKVSRRKNSANADPRPDV